MSEKSILPQGLPKITPILKRGLTTTTDIESGLLNSAINESMLKSELSLCEVRTIISNYKLYEPQANIFLRFLGYPEIAGYLILTSQLDFDVEIIKTHDLRRLLIDTIHSVVLEKPITEVVSGLSVERPQILDDLKFEKFQGLLTDKILPLIKDRNYQSIAQSMINDIVESYPAFESQTRTLLIYLIKEASDIGQLKYLQEIKNNQDKINSRAIDNSNKENHKIELAVENFLTDLRMAKHVGHPTKYEILLRLFKSHNYQAIELNDLGKALFVEGNDLDRAIQYKISRLNARLRPYGIQIERSSSYMLRKSEIPESNIVK